MQASNAVKLCSINSIEFPLEGEPIALYYDIIDKELLDVLLAIHSIKVATRQEVSQDVRDFLSS